MITEVYLWGRPVGRLADDPRMGGIVFQYAPPWLSDGLSISPLQLPLEPGPRRNPDARPFSGLYGIFSDSLPDSWGQMLMDERFRRAGVNPETVGVLERLCYVGHRGWGALTYQPDREAASAQVLEAMDLVEAERSARAAVEGRLADVLPQVIESGASTGGARPKQRIAIPQNSGDAVWYGKSLPPPGYEPWIIKIETDPARQYGLVEKAYYMLAELAAIAVPETRLIGAAPGAAQHFAVKRFDWLPHGRLHCHTLSGMLNRNAHTGATDYDELLRTVLLVTSDQRDVNEAFRRMVFNVSFGVRDDHTKNHAFTMDASGTWRLSPAYDVTYSRPGIGNGLHRQMPVRGKRTGIDRGDISSLAEDFSISAKTLENALDALHAAANQWDTIADSLGLTRQRRNEIRETWEFPRSGFRW